MNIIEMAFRVTERVTAFREQVRRFFYEVMLSGHCCPKCESILEMTQDRHALCTRCHATLDPTIAFQRCSVCGGRPRLRIRRYVCRECGLDIRSRFLFDGLVFDFAYFRRKMAEHRDRKRELRERVRALLAGTRSGAVAVEPIQRGEHADLFMALDAMAREAYAGAIPESRDRFDLGRYQTHIRAHLREFPVGLDRIPPLGENARIDRIWRFVAVIFLAHAGLAHVWQEEERILVMKREVDREGQAVPGDLEDPDGVEGSVGRAEA